MEGDGFSKKEQEEMETSGPQAGTEAGILKSPFMGPALAPALPSTAVTLEKVPLGGPCSSATSFTHTHTHRDHLLNAPKNRVKKVREGEAGRAGDTGLELVC